MSSALSTLKENEHDQVPAPAAALTFAAPALAEDRSFTHEGITYVYTARNDGSARVLEGKASAGGKFRLVVQNGWVRGRVGTVPVSFRAPKRGEAPVLVAAR